MPYDPHDTLENYEVDGLIGRGGSSKVHAARCMRGRLRGRRVALKIIPLTSLPTSSHLTHHVSSTDLHLKLHHPSIMSLLSTFNTANQYCQVLELCSMTLSTFITNRTVRSLTESEARGVLRTVVDALVYLARETVLHRDIKADNILITEDGRVKLGDFGLAVRLQAPTFEATTFCGTPNYLAPEVVRRRPYGATTDIWALGCLTITILTGQPPFQGKTVDETLQRVRRADFSLPDSLSPEVKDFIKGLLQVKPERRTPVGSLLSQPFFLPSLPVTPLNPQGEGAHTRSQPLRSRVSLSAMANKENVTPTARVPRRATSVRSIRVPVSPLPPVETAPKISEREVLGPSGSNRPRRTSDAGKTKPRISALSEAPSPFQNPIRKTALGATAAPSPARSRLDSQKLHPSILDTTTSPISSLYHASHLDTPIMHNRLRILKATNDFAYAPPSGEPKLPASSSRTQSTLVQTASFLNSSDFPPHSTIQESHVASTSIAAFANNNAKKRTPTSISGHGPTRSAHTGVSPSSIPAVTRIAPLSYLSTTSRSPASMAVIDNNNTAPPGPEEQYRQQTPAPFNTIGIPPRVHTTHHGQLEVLDQALGLVVDLRISERRAGRAGDEVLRVSADGDYIEIFRAPELDVPCRFIAPLRSYTLAQLPHVYWKRYRFASRFVDMIRSRTPKFILFTPKAKCTMMSNGPDGDIELHLLPPSGTLSSLGEPTMRIRLSPKDKTIEISRFTPGLSKVPIANVSEKQSKTGEWSKKVLSLPSKTSGLAKVEGLTEEEEGAMQHLEECRRVCAKLDGATNTTDQVREGKGKGKAVPNPLDTRPGLWESYIDRPNGPGYIGGQSSPVLREGTWEEIIGGRGNLRGAVGPQDPEPRDKPLPSLPSRQRSRDAPHRSTRPSRKATVEMVGDRSAQTESYVARQASALQRALDEALGTKPKDEPVQVTTPSKTREESKFIPHLGWCVKHSELVGRESKPIKYTVMFLDGASLEIDGNQNFATLTDRHGKPSGRVPISEAAPKKFRERLVVFNEFLQLFDAAPGR